MVNERYVNREQYNSTLKKELKQALIKLSEQTRIPASKLLDEAVELLLEKHNFNTQP